MKQSLLFIFICISGTFLKAQSPEIDSLRSDWNNAQLTDSERMEAMHMLIYDHYLFSKPDSAFVLLEEQYAFAEKAKVPSKMSRARSMQGISWAVRGNLDKAIEYFTAALKISQRLDNPDGIASDLGNLANVSQMKGDFASAIEYTERSLTIFDALGDEDGILKNYLILGNLNTAQGELDNATYYYKEGLKMSENMEDKLSQSIALSSLAKLAEQDGNDSLALSYFQQSLALKEEVNNRVLMASSHKNIGRIYLERGNLVEARSYLDQSLELSLENDNKEIQCSALSLLSGLELEEGNYALAVELSEQAYKFADDLGLIYEATQAAKALYEAYKANQSHDKALLMHEIFVELTDSTKNEENKKNVLQQRFQYEYDKKETLARAEQEKKDVRQALIRNSTLAGLGGSLLFLFIVYRQRNSIKREKERSEELLLNILPKETAQELKEKGQSDAKLIDLVTVIFTDFKGFTSLSEQVTPKELVADLHACFSEFDHICEKYGIEKIKTIGDSYMAAGGLPTPNQTHAKDIVQAALEMVQIVEGGKAKKIAKGLPFFEIRVGVNTGPVVAGIVGIKKFQYDIWGDTVNTASRLESSGEIGKVNISQSTYLLLKDDTQFSFENRGKVVAKSKGEMKMYFVKQKI